VSEPEQDKGKWKPGTMELATLKRADAELEKAKVSAGWLTFAHEVFEWVKKKFTKE
jgi:hypothetical protein